METEYWTGRWERGETGWHKAEVNPYLVRYWDSAGVLAGGRVLVPLCGKSLDLGWLASRGHSVLGVELSPLAIAGFFTEADLLSEIAVRRVGPIGRPAEPADAPGGRFEVTGARGIDLACGDIFDLEVLDLASQGVVGLYDRASLIALPPALRARYAETLCRCLPPGARGLVVTLEYDQTLRDGPPFSVGPAEVERLFGGRFEVRPLCDDDILHENPGFVQAGVPWLREHAFALTDVMKRE